MFRYKKSIHEVSYENQVYIYAYSKRYQKLTASEKRMIEDLCKKATEMHYKALLEFVTTDTGAVTVCNRYFMSQSTLERAVRRYYIEFEKQL